MKRLFCVANSHGVRHPQAGFFTSKQEAKETRDELNKEHGEFKYHVSLGPDHIGKHGIPSKMRKNKDTFERGIVRGMK